MQQKLKEIWGNQPSTPSRRVDEKSQTFRRKQTHPRWTKWGGIYPAVRAADKTEALSNPQPTYKDSSQFWGSNPQNSSQWKIIQ